MHTKQIIVAVDTDGCVDRAKWVVQFTPFEETLMREYVARCTANPTEGRQQSFDAVVVEHIESTAKRFGWQWSYAEEYIEARFDDMLFEYLTLGVDGRGADEVVSS